MEKQSQTTDLRPGTLYRIKWREHYRHYQVEPGYLGRFLKWENRHDSLHGDFISREALFQRVKTSGRYGSRFAVPLADVSICEELRHD